MVKRFRFLLVTLLMVFTTVLQAQVTTSSMSGRVTDAEGPVIGATVIATHTPSGTTYGTVTNLEGRYSLSNMRIGGPYTVQISYIGYNSVKYTDVNLSLGENAVLNVPLEESTIALDAIEVVASRFSNMSSDQAGAITNVTSRTIVSMPTVNRDLTDLTRLTPQANGAAIGGGTYRQNNITIDGASFNNKFGIGQSMPANGSPISLDAIEQVSVSITPYDVRQSGFLGASVNAVTRSGDNQFRASVYTYLNNENFKGNSVSGTKFDKSESSYSSYGIRMGGPIIKNKLFYFVNFETEKTMVPGPSRVASSASNPYTDGSNNVARPTVEDMDKMSKYLKDTYGYETGPYAGYSDENPGLKFLGRLDWNINSNHKLNVRYNITKRKSPSYPSTSISGIAPAPYASANNRTKIHAMWYQNSGYFQEQNFSSIAAELNSIFGNVNNTLRVTYIDQDEPRSTGGKAFPFVDILKDGLPYVSFGTELFSYGNLRKVQSYTITDDVKWSVGAHRFTAGIQFEHDNTKNGFQRFGTGYYAFNSWDDFVNGVAPNTFALTHPNNSNLTQEFPSFKFNQLTGYIQDEFDVTENFKLSGGLRLDLPFYPKINTFNKKVYDLDFGGRKFDTSSLPSAKLMFSPRLGFNYDILGDRSMVLRGGSGIFTGTIPFVWIVAQAGDAGVLQTTVTKESLGMVPTFKPTLDEIIAQIYPSGFNPSEPAAPSAVSKMDEDLRLPQNWKSSIALDAKLPNNILATIEGVYSKDINSVVVENAGLKPDGFKIKDYPDDRTISKRQYYQSLNNVYLLKNGGSNYYYSLTAKLEKEFNFGLSAMAAYTYSGGKSSRDGIGDQLGSSWYNDPTIYGSNDYTMGYSGYIVPNRIIASLSYKKEYAKHFATTISLFYQGASQGRFTYVHENSNGGILNDRGGSSIIYIPKDDSEIQFVDYKTGSDVYSAEQQRKDFWSYVEQDKYLSKNKGKYAQRGGVLYPWVNTFDFKILQDFYLDVNGKRNVLQVGLDIMNVGNLLNDKWGIRNYYNKNNFLKVANMNQVLSGEGSVKPTFNFMKNGNEVLTKTFNPNISYSSTYYMQLSIRYIFN